MERSIPAPDRCVSSHSLRQKRSIRPLLFCFFHAVAWLQDIFAPQDIHKAVATFSLDFALFTCRKAKACALQHFARRPIFRSGTRPDRLQLRICPKSRCTHPFEHRTHHPVILIALCEPIRCIRLCLTLGPTERNTPNGMFPVFRWRVQTFAVGQPVQSAES